MVVGIGKKRDQNGDRQNDQQLDDLLFDDAASTKEGKQVKQNSASGKMKAPGQNKSPSTDKNEKTSPATRSPGTPPRAPLKPQEEVPVAQPKATPTTQEATSNPPANPQETKDSSPQREENQSSETNTNHGLSSAKQPLKKALPQNRNNEAPTQPSLSRSAKIMSNFFLQGGAYRCR